MVVLVTGGSGFLGRQIVHDAQRAGNIVLAPRSTEMDLMKLDSVLNYIRRNRHPDAIIHSAAYYGGIGINVHQPSDLWYINSMMALNVWEAAACADIGHVLSVGSACAYPGDLTGDFKEEDLERGPCHGSVEGYGMTKRVHSVCQRICKKQHGIVGAQAVLTNLYGPFDDYTEYRSHVVAALIARFCKAKKLNLPKVECWGDGSPVREFLHVFDAADAIVQCLDMPDIGPVNIGTGVGTSIKEFVELLVAITGYEGEVIWDTSKPGGASRKVLNVSKATRELGWQASRSLTDGLKHTVDWYMDNWSHYQNVL